MNAINLYTYSRIDKDDCSEYATLLLNSDKKLRLKIMSFYL